MDRDQFLSDNNDLYKIIQRDIVKKPLWIGKENIDISYGNQFQ